MNNLSSNQEHTLLGGRYLLLEQIGLGGMARVYHAKDRNLHRDVAIKVLREDWVDQPSFRSNFLHEARAAANLSHPNIVTIFDFGHESNQLYIVMEYIQGTDLKTLIRRKKRFSVQESVALMIKICHGVGYAHRAGLIHCDLKPQNILVTADESAKITDFGIARALASIDPDEQSDIVWGSPLYFSPEQARGEAPSPASDVYSLGVIFFEMLTGEPLFKADDSTTLAEMHSHKPAPSPRQLNPDIPPALEQIILKVLSKEPSARYRSADQLGRILEMLDQPLRMNLSQVDAASVPTTEERYHMETMAMDPPSQGSVDWIAVGLGLAAFLALGGLLPLWLWACLLYPSCPINVS